MAYITAIIPAAGQGKRMNNVTNKQFLELRGVPVLVHTLRVFEVCHPINNVIVVAAPGEESFCQTVINEYSLKKVTRVITGGKERQHSVANGLAYLPEETTIVAVHDGARPLLLPIHLENVIKEVEDAADGALLAVRVKDTLKEVNQGRAVTKTLDRSTVWAAQTPQVFRRDVIVSAYDKAFREGFIGTDDASLVERYGYQVKVVDGSYENIKITTPEDLDFAATVLDRRG